ncbi:putative Elongation of very long chain fatty acids protein 5 [Hypsibius exemplaris]|uniref:Elongation of very long chain fatty acids protein n=1 Tax=Hypsibius exemplaris TaxID=2072580 RepID=A0A9X6RJD7_HYPEX|nr:putative Elongation of very long chain fatty acids protein 5 [Hypsibius exemplaris]
MANNTTTWGSLLRYYDNITEDLYQRSDARTRDMLFMRNMGGMFLLTASYLVMAVVGPRIMAKRKAFELKWPMFIYNVAISIFSLWMCLEMLTQSWKSGYSYLCDPYKLSYAPADIRIVNVIWWYFVSKAIEFLDTVFMVLRKKNNQITVLHTWHHSFMLPCFYFVTLLGPCGLALQGPIINAFVHVVMYAYYALSLFPQLAPFLWWKKYLTQMQLLQFFLLLTNNVYGLVVACDFPPVLAYIQLCFLGSLVVLFTNFYIKAYIKGKKHGGRGGRTQRTQPEQPHETEKKEL